MVLDIFSGSNTTGAAAEAAQRRWIAFEKNQEYLAASAFRFLDSEQSKSDALMLFQKLIDTQETIEINRHEQLQLVL